MAAPLVKGFEKGLNGLFLGPEVAVQRGRVRDRHGTLLSHQSLNRRVPGSGIAGNYRTVVRFGVSVLAIQFGHGFTRSPQVYRNPRYSPGRKTVVSARQARAPAAASIHV
jgi:hypothetical protein